MRKTSLTLLTFMLLALVATSASAQAVFYPDHLGELNMGEVLFRTPKRDSIQFRNTGNEELVIHKVESSCGCLSVRVKPGAHIPAKTNNKGWIVVEYDGQILGQFERYIKVFANDQKEPHYIYFRGRVVQELLGSPEDFPYNLGNVRMDKDRLDFGIVHFGDTIQRKLKVYNSSMTPYRPSMHHLPNYLKAKSEPAIIPSERSGVVTITLDTRKLPSLGLKQDAFFLAGYSESVNTDGRIDCQVVMTQDFSALTPAQRAQAPKMELSTDSVRFGEMGKKKKLEQYVIIKNTGLTDLKLYSVNKLGTAFSSLAMSAMEIKPGKKIKMVLTLTADDAAKQKDGELNSRILLLTNDPENAAKYIEVSVSTKQPVVP